MLSITQLAPIFARLDEEQGGGDVAAVEKALRNFTQRFPIAPTGTEGRAFVYDRGAIVALRLAYLAHQFGINRILLHAYARFLSTHAGEAVSRVVRGEEFAFQVVSRPIGDDVWASWEEPEIGAELSRADAAIWLMRRRGIELGRFTQSASVVRQVLSALPRDQE